VTISGGSHYARQFEDRSVIKMAPAARGPCRRIQSRCMVLSDGRVTLCDQDVQGRQTIGQLAENSLRELWQGSQFTQIRSAHQQGRFDAAPLCPACDEWHRP